MRMAELFCLKVHIKIPTFTALFLFVEDPENKSNQIKILSEELFIFIYQRISGRI